MEVGADIGTRSRQLHAGSSTATIGLREMDWHRVVSAAVALSWFVARVLLGVMHGASLFGRPQVVVRGLAGGVVVGVFTIIEMALPLAVIWFAEYIEDYLDEKTPAALVRFCGWAVLLLATWGRVAIVWALAPGPRT